VIFDNQYNYFAANSGFQQVGANGILTRMVLMNLPIASIGHLFNYINNATAKVYAPMLGNCRFKNIGRGAMGTSWCRGGIAASRRDNRSVYLQKAVPLPKPNPKFRRPSF
jgi:hypothetical protein